MFCISERLNALPEDSDLSFGNSVYTIRFDSRDQQAVFGDRYWFYLRDAVDDVPEYVVRWDNFVQSVLSFLHVTETDFMI